MDLTRQRQLELEAEAELELEDEHLSGVMQRSAPPQTAAEAAVGGFGNILNGLTLGFGDEIVGAGAGLLDYAGDWNRPLGDYVSERMKQSEGLRKGFKKENPWVGNLSELAGVVNNPINLARTMGPAASVTGRIAQEAGTGALQGGVFGAGEAAPGSRLEGAGMGAAVGGALGAAGGVIGEGVKKLPEIGSRLQRAAMGIRQSDVKAAANDAPRGAQNPLIKAFDNLQEEGVFKGDKSPEAVQARLTERAAGINKELDDVLVGANTASGPATPLFFGTQQYVRKLKGTDFEAANDIFQKEVAALEKTLDDGGTVADWQQAKRSLQGNSKYGTSSASLENEVRTRIASDIRQHIEKAADVAIPGAAGDVKALNQKLSEGLRFGEVTERSKNAAAARDPEAWLRSQFRTSGGFGVPMLLAAGSGAGEYNRSGSIPKALAAGALGAAAGTPSGKYALGALIKSGGFLAPEIATRAATPFAVRLFAKQAASQKQVEPTPIDYFKAGARGINAMKEVTGGDSSSLDTLYREAAMNYKNFAAPTGKVDPVKARKWLANNSSALAELPDLKEHLSSPENAQRLIDKNLQGETPLTPEEVDLHALKEFTNIEPQNFITQALASRNPVENLRQTMGYLRSDKQATAGLRRATLAHLNETGSYEAQRDLLEKGGLFTPVQIKVADFLYGHKADDAMPDNSTLKAVAQMAGDGFLGSAPFGKYIDLIEPIIKGTPPEVLKSKVEQALLDPLLARDLMNKANTGNVTRGLQALFKDEIEQAFGGQQAPAAPAPAPKPVIAKQQQVTSKKSFPTPEELLRPKAPGELKKTSFNVQQFIAGQPAETRARVGAESSGNPRAVSPKGAQGLSQLMPETAQEIAQELGEVYMPLRDGMAPEEEAASIEQNVRFGNHYYKKQLRQFKKPTLAWAAYNAGPRRVQDAMKMAGSSTDVNKILSNLPKGVQKETIPYVEKIARQYGGA